MRYSVFMKLAGLMLAPYSRSVRPALPTVAISPIFSHRAGRRRPGSDGGGGAQCLKAQGFEEAGSYSPYAGAVVIVFTSPELKAAAAANKYGGFGAGIRVALTEYKGKLQVSYINPPTWARPMARPAPGRERQARGGARKVTEFGSEIGRTASSSPLVCTTTWSACRTSIRSTCLPVTRTTSPR